MFGALVPESNAIEDLDLVRTDLSYASLKRARLVRCGFTESALVGACLDDGTIELCDFSRANLDRARLSGARIIWSRFAGAIISDSMLDRVTFTHCDLRGADLSAPRFGDFAATTQARFISCDLRETSWRDRWLSAVKIVDCKLYGATGRPRLEGTEIQGADLSVAGDGSRPATSAEVIDTWERR